MKKSPALTVYLCGPITGLPNQNLGCFQTARREVEAKGYRTIMPHDLFRGIDTSDYSHNDYMRSCIRALMVTKILVVLPGWQNSIGANKEVQIASMLNIPVVHVADLNPIKEYSVKISPLKEKLIALEHRFNNAWGWFFSPSKNYKNQQLDR